MFNCRRGHDEAYSKGLKDLVWLNLGAFKELMIEFLSVLGTFSLVKVN